jgi:hypothetical protein
VFSRCKVELESESNILENWVNTVVIKKSVAGNKFFWYRFLFLNELIIGDNKSIIINS